MKSAKEMINYNKDVKDILIKNFMLEKQNKEFASLCNRLELDDEILANYTSKLCSSVCELNNCKNCKGLDFCKNEVKGYVDFPEVDNEQLIFSYIPCKYKKENDKNKSKVVFYETSKLLREAKISNIYTDDISRKDLLKYINKFLKDIDNSKGSYVYGSFGSGKSYIMNALLNELSKKNKKCVSIYYPTLLKKLKDSFSNNTTSYEQLFTELEMCDYLLIDDIGAENNTMWSRDEVLSSLLQTRMDENKCTFFTSNLDLEELEEHLSITNSGSDKVKARRLIERIKELCIPIALIGENKRNSN